ncbi:hypothetical protein ACQ4M3_16180 [Leptolyngbya sp. AN03gr2]|uniref:hypothetical protein n=1 Tax=unclassified Leptolyngbya TaxID=2650499 RepID=UPI003D30F235
MAGTKRRSPTSTLVSKDSISSASTALQDLPEKPKEIWSLREAIHLLKDQITQALDRGYSYSEVSQMLSSKGVEISPSTLKYYLSSARKEDGTKSRRRRRTLTMTAEALQNGSDALETETPEKEDKPKRTRSAAKSKTDTKSPAKSKAKATTSRKKAVS